MLRLDKVLKSWKEAAALNDHINLYGFWNETAFLTKSGDVGMVQRRQIPAMSWSMNRSRQTSRIWAIACVRWATASSLVTSL
jgi:hypothetical protein